MVRVSLQSAPLSLLLSFVIICNIIICETKDSCHQKDKQILLSFKHELTDPSDMLSTWSSEKDCCEWKGVKCDINGRVKNLSLPCITDDFIIIDNEKNKTHCLTGKFHLSLFELEFLNYLNLRNNDFKVIHLPLDCQNLSLVNIPCLSGNFSNVVHLDLSENENLVVDDLRWLLRLSSSLEYLNLTSIDLHKETHWLQILTMLPKLSELYLSSCLLESASSSLKYANFTSLEYLDLSHNDFFSEIPNWLFNLSGLSYLNLEDNRFHGKIPETLLNLQNLHSLNLRDNLMNGTIPDWIGQLGSLQYLNLRGNLLIGSIPTSLGNLSSLTFLSVRSNKLIGSLPEILGKLSNLEVLSVLDNSFSGVVTHRNFVKLFNLKQLVLGSPFFIFDFNPDWIPPFKLQAFALEYADLKRLPWLYTQTSLTYLEINNSSFTNESQDMFWSLATHFYSLILNNNYMPWDMSNVLLNSEIVLMLGNGLNGGFPRLTSNVIYCMIIGNNFSGSLSPLLCHNTIEQTNLKLLAVSNNHLSGELPDCWANWKSLNNVDVGNNNLTGMIPHSMGTLSNLTSLSIYNTSMHGDIPVSLRNCQKLVIVNLSENKFSGKIPSWIGQNVKALQLRSNEFSGDIPLQICQLSSLLVLDLANNRLTGTIPYCLNNITAMIFNNDSKGDGFGYLTINANNQIIVTIKFSLVVKGNWFYYGKYMRVIDISNNSLSGRIPSQVFRLTGLKSLNLSQNHLIGTIPEEIGNMKQLESLDLSHNTLSGEIPQSMSSLSFLEALNLSFNNLKGQIPLGTQLQGFTPLSYMGNPELCGTPLIEKCNHNETKLMPNDEEESELNMEWFYMGMGVGFAISFWIVFGSLLFKQTWRHAHFNFLYDVKHKFMPRSS